MGWTYAWVCVLQAQTHADDKAACCEDKKFPPALE